jgi:hypothetical protein
VETGTYLQRAATPVREISRRWTLLRAHGTIAAQAGRSYAAHVRRALLASCTVALLLGSGCAFGVAERARFLASTSVTVDGTLHSNRTSATGETVYFHFEYGKTTAYGTRFGFGQVAVNFPGSGYDVATKLTGLEPGTTYHYRLCGGDRDNQDVRFRGCVGDQTFTTPTTTGPYLTMNPYCLSPNGPVEGVDITGTGFPPTNVIGQGPVIGLQVARDGGAFQPGQSRRADTAGDIDFGGQGFPPGQVFVWDARAFLDPNFNGTLDPGEQVLATQHYDERC